MARIEAIAWSWVTCSEPYENCSNASSGTKATTSSGLYDRSAAARSVAAWYGSRKPPFVVPGRIEWRTTRSQIIDRVGRCNPGS